MTNTAIKKANKGFNADKADALPVKPGVNLKERKNTMTEYKYYFTEYMCPKLNKIIVWNLKYHLHPSSGTETLVQYSNCDHEIECGLGPANTVLNLCPIIPQIQKIKTP
jgi:hypothetical protein